MGSKFNKLDMDDNKQSVIRLERSRKGLWNYTKLFPAVPNLVTSYVDFCAFYTVGQIV